MTISDRIKRTSPSRFFPYGVVQTMLMQWSVLFVTIKNTRPLDGIKNILSGYAQVYFSKKWLPGLLFCLSTFVIPVVGVAGLTGLLLSILFAHLLGFSRGGDDGIFFAFNGLLTALALALTYTINLPCIVILVLSIFLCVLIASALRTLFEKYLFIPVLSLPFVITTWIVIAAGRKFGGLIYTTTPFEIEVLSGVFPEPVEFMFRSFGAAFFQLNVPSGILVALGILIYSRHAFFVAALALFCSSFFHMASGGSLSDLNSHWIGFNFALTAIALGGMFVVPGIYSYLLAIMGALLSSVVAAGALIILDPFGLPVLALPFIFTTLAVLYPLRNRLSPRLLTSITQPMESPEANLKHYKNPRARFVADDTPAFHLPVNGKWTITQSFNGNETHKDLWAHALDFEVTDESGSTWQNSGEQLSDYYAWNMPVVAPADGVVTRVISHIEDNHVGQVDTENNWGNSVIIWHYGIVYSCLSHLAKESVCVTEGERLRKGKMIGKVGNSGRSPFPHLHFQVQSSPELGAHTIPFNLLYYSSKEQAYSEYNIYGIPGKNEVVETVQVDTGMVESVSFPIGRKWTFDICDRGKTRQEIWESEIDFIGNRFLRCKETNAKLSFFLNANVLLILDYEGPSNTALEWLFLASPCVPLTRQNIQRVETLPAEKVLKTVPRFLFDCVEPVYDMASLTASIRYSSMGTGQLILNTQLSLKQQLFRQQLSNWNVQTTFARHRGLISLEVTSSGKTVLTISQRGIS